MTTTAAVETIRYTIQAGNALTDGTPTRDALRRLAEETAEALAAEFPGAEVECPIEQTSGARPASYTQVVLADPEADDYDVRERLEIVAGRTWERWCQSLADSDVEQPVAESQIRDLRREAGEAGDVEQVRHYAAIDSGSISGAVYGVGTTEAAALADAIRGSEGEYRVVPCSAAAYEYVLGAGGAPSPRLHVSARGVEFVPEGE